MTTPRIAVVSAGLSQPSSTRLLADRLAAATSKELPEPLVEFVELREYAHELANNLVTGFPSGKLREVVDQVTTADALIAVTPIFNASYSGLFKTFFDVLDKDALVGLPVLLGATGGSPRHSLALEHAVRPMFTYLRAVVVPTSVYAAAEDWGGELDNRIDRAAQELAALVVTSPARRPVDPYAEPTPFEQLLSS